MIKLTNNTDTGGREGDADDPLFNDKITKLARPEILVSSIDPLTILLKNQV